MKRNLIAVSGTHGTSKSSTAYQIAADMKRNGYNVVVIDELARECPLKINQEATELTQYWILVSQMKREIELMDKYDYVISDRSVFDTLSYATTLKLLEVNLDDIISHYVKRYYKYIFLLDPNGFNYHINDGIRDMDPDFRMEIHNNLIRLYDKFNINYIHMETAEVLKGYINRVFNLK